MTSVHLLHAGYCDDRTASSVVLVRDGDALIVVDPGMVARRSLILDPLRELGVAPEAEVVDFWARYKDDLWLDHDGEGYRPSPRTELWLTPGHTEEDLTFMVEAEDGVYAMTHLWWRADRTPDLDPVCADDASIRVHRERVLAAADVVIPGHGEPFRVQRRAR